MSDPTTLAKTARESLARGLSALQGPGVPDAVSGVAEPVAQAMSALHRVEASAGGVTAEAAPVALAAVRQALSMLQGQAGVHPAVDQAMEAVAGALGQVHTLTKSAPAVGLAGTMVMQPGPAPQTAPAVAPQPYAAPQPMAAQPVAPQPAAGWAPAAGFPAPAPQQPGYPPQQAAPQPYAQHAAPAAYPQQAAGYPQPQPAAFPPQQAAQAAVAPGWQAPQQPWPAQEAQPAAASHPHAAMGSQPGAAVGSHPQAAPGPATPIAAPPGAKRAEANLGAHSPSNFYKGLSGNDVIESGGIFVSTYQIPDLGETVVIHITLPGGYEFEALGTVEWSREAPQSTGDGVEAPPGFGAKFTQISPEGRQLVYRYVRNREPLFHDDL